jgi:hypothetical protein
MSSASGTTSLTSRSLGFASVDDRSGEKQLHRLELAQRPQHALRAARARHDADLDLGLAEFRALAGDDDVGVHGELAAAAEREAVHGGDHGLRTRREGLPLQVGAAQHHLGGAAFRHVLEVGARREGLARTREDDDAHLGIGAQPIERRRERDARWDVEALRASGRSIRTRTAPGPRSSTMTVEGACSLTLSSRVPPCGIEFRTIDRRHSPGLA